MGTRHRLALVLMTCALPAYTSASVSVAQTVSGAASAQVAPAQENRPALVLDLPTPEEALEADAPGLAADPRSVAAREAAEAQAAAEAEAARVREANARQLEAVRTEAQQAAAARRLADEERQARYRATLQAHDEALTEYAARIAAAEEARRRWELDVAACKAGDRNRCATPARAQ